MDVSVLTDDDGSVLRAAVEVLQRRSKKPKSLALRVLRVVLLQAAVRCEREDGLRP